MEEEDRLHDTPELLNVIRSLELYGIKLRPEVLPIINACITSLPEVAINTNQGLPDKSSVVNACTASLPEVAINTNPGLPDMPGVLHACTASLPEMAINTNEGMFDQTSVLNACTVGTKAQVASVTDWTDTVPPSKATKPLEEVFPQFWELGGKELCEAIIEQTEADRGRRNSNVRRGDPVWTRNRGYACHF